MVLSVYEALERCECLTDSAQCIITSFKREIICT